MAGFIKYMRSEEAEFLLSYPNANHLFMVMAFRARRADHPMNGLKAGQCFLGDIKKIGLTERQYRTAKSQLEKWNLATFKGTSKGTIGTVLNTKVYDINEEDRDEQETSKRRATDEQPTTNKECNNGIKKEKEDLVTPSEQPKDKFDFEKTRLVWNEICGSSRTVCSKKMVVCEKMKKGLNACYRKYKSACKAKGRTPIERIEWCGGYFRAVHDWAEPWAGKREGDNFKLNLEYASRLDTYDKVLEWIAND